MATITYAVEGSLIAAIDETGLSPGQYQYRIVARITTSPPAGGPLLSFTGKVEVTIP